MKGKCSKSFPQPFKTATTFDDNGFVYYKGCHQRNNFILKDEIQLYTDYVVLYNRQLLLRYNAHINVEVCCKLMLIKNLFKYVSKGPDRCRMAIEKEKNDEIMFILQQGSYIFLYCF